MESEELLEMAERLEQGAFDGNPTFLFSHKVDADGHIIVEGDQGGLREFAAQILRLIARPYFSGVHHHFDDAGTSDEGSVPLIVSRREEID